jgi:hypothetical protein
MYSLILMGPQILLGYHNIMLWTHMNDMKLFGSNRYGVMAGNRVNFYTHVEVEDTLALKRQNAD